MANPQTYSAVSVLRNGHRVEIRAQRPDDQNDIISAVERVSPSSLFRRFFAVKRYFSDREIAFFTNVDFVNHVSLVAVAEENGRPVIVGGGRFIVLRPGKAEVALTVIDQYQGQGIGSDLMRHLIIMARSAGLQELVAEVLADNIPMLKVLEKSGLPLTTKRETEVTTVVLQLS